MKGVLFLIFVEGVLAGAYIHSFSHTVKGEKSLVSADVGGALRQASLFLGGEEETVSAGEPVLLKEWLKIYALMQFWGDTLYAPQSREAS